MDEIRIRPAGIEDLDCILRHRVSMFSEMGGHYAAGLDQLRAVSEAYLLTALADGTYREWLAEAGERVVGGGGVVIVPWPGYPGATQPRRAWILNMYTEPEFRHRGIARRIMAVILDWCRAEGFPSVSLHASAEGRRIYERLGFVATSEMRLQFE